MSSDLDNKPWYKLLSRYHWYVLLVAALGWLFDTMDQQIFVMAASPALSSLGIAPDELRAYRGLATSIFIAGWATGGLVFGLFGDRIGRARTMILTILMYSVFTGLSAFSTHWYDFAFYRFLTGMGVGGEFAAGVALVAEVMPARARPYAIGLLQASSTIGNAIAALVNLALPPNQVMSLPGLSSVEGWRLMFLVGLLPALLVVVIRRTLKEPETWVDAKQKSVDDLEKQLGDIREMFGTPRWRYHSIIGVLLGMAGVMGLWGVIFWLPELIRETVPADLSAYSNTYVTIGMLLLNLGAAIGIYGFSVVSGWIGRKTAFALSYVLALLSAVLVFGFMTELHQIYWMPIILGFCTLMLFGGFAIYFPELYPTRLRATGTGFCYNVARYLAAVGPFLLGHLVGVYRNAGLTFLEEMGGGNEPLRYAALTVATVYLIGLAVVPFAPETKDQPLPE